MAAAVEGTAIAVRDNHALVRRYTDGGPGMARHVDVGYQPGVDFDGLISVVGVGIDKFREPQQLTGIADLNAQLSLSSSVILIAISIVITMVGGLLPAKKAAKKDPVIALRTE